MDVHVVNDVVVVESEDDRFIAIAQLVDQQRQHVLVDGRARAVQRGLGVRPKDPVDRLQRGDDAVPETDGIVVAGVQRDPREGSLLARIGVPFGEEARLARARRSRNQGEPARGAINNLAHQLRATNRIRPRAGDMQLRPGDDRARAGRWDRRRRGC